MEYPKFTNEMKKDYKILIPTMLPIHFELIAAVLGNYGYNVELLKIESRKVKDEGLKNVHNDTCYPALIVIGQFIAALKSGDYDVNKTAVLITQTGGGCRASNYFYLLRKTLKREFPQVPVLSLNISGLEKDNSIHNTLGLGIELTACCLYGDMIMTLYNQTRSYQIDGEADKARDDCFKYCIDRVHNPIRFFQKKKIYRYILNRFSTIDLPEKRKPKVGIVGEIYVKYSSLANNHLEDFIVSEGCEPVVPGLLDYILYSLSNTITDHKLYKRSRWTFIPAKMSYNYINRRINEQIRIVKKYPKFTPPESFDENMENCKLIINQGVKMGEGWLIPAEMVTLGKNGVKNIVCAQPFGCLPNHIVGKGMIRPVKKICPDVNIAPIDYDPDATKVNIENRIKLMLSNIER